MASLVLAMTLSMYSLGWMEGRLALLAPSRCCRFESMIRFGMEKSSDHEPAAEGADVAAVGTGAGALIEACDGCRPSHSLCPISNEMVFESFERWK